MFKVIELSSSDVKETMLKLAKKMNNDGLKPSYIIGILNGGYDPARYFASFWKEKDVELIFYKLQRKTTGKWKTFFVRLIKKLPKQILNLLRIIEMSFYSWKHQNTKSKKQINKEIINFFEKELKINKISKKRPLVIVDDAIDTGNTINQIVKSLEQCGLNKEAIKVVVVVHTLPDPFIIADYYKYKDVILRFPWSNDS